jgi:hypothetical protein
MNSVLDGFQHKKSARESIEPGQTEHGCAVLSGFIFPGGKRFRQNAGY